MKKLKDFLKEPDSISKAPKLNISTDMPADILLEIAQHLSVTDLQNLQLSNTKFQKLRTSSNYDSMIWKNKVFSFFGFFQNESYFQSLLKQYENNEITYENIFYEMLAYVSDISDDSLEDSPEKFKESNIFAKSIIALQENRIDDFLDLMQKNIFPIRGYKNKLSLISWIILFNRDQNKHIIKYMRNVDNEAFSFGKSTIKNQIVHSDLLVALKQLGGTSAFERIVRNSFFSSKMTLPNAIEPPYLIANAVRYGTENAIKQSYEITKARYAHEEDFNADMQYLENQGTLLYEAACHHNLAAMKYLIHEKKGDPFFSMTKTNKNYHQNRNAFQIFYLESANVEMESKLINEFVDYFFSLSPNKIEVDTFIMTFNRLNSNYKIPQNHLAIQQAMLTYEEEHNLPSFATRTLKEKFPQYRNSLWFILVDNIPLKQYNAVVNFFPNIMRKIQQAFNRIVNRSGYQAVPTDDTHTLYKSVEFSKKKTKSSVEKQDNDISESDSKAFSKTPTSYLLKRTIQKSTGEESTNKNLSKIQFKK